MNHAEDNEQKALFQWAKTQREPEYKWLFHIPNGGKRDKREAARLKAQGVKPGVSDLFLPVPRGGKHGLWIEMKANSNKPTEKQQLWLDDMEKQGFEVAVCWTWMEARDVLKRYISQSQTVTV